MIALIPVRGIGILKEVGSLAVPEHAFWIYYLFVVIWEGSKNPS